MPLLKVENLSKTFDGPAKLFGSEQFYAVKDVSFSLSRKETLAIIGKNGSGKSTLVKMIAPITPPTSGKILFNDLPLQFEDFHYRAQHIRMVFQDANSAFQPSLKYWSSLRCTASAINYRIWDEETRNQKIFETLSLVGPYPDYTNLKIKHLSVSQKQRIAFWLAHSFCSLK
ncbi:MAG: ATP-binding cassette domain-containing protein [Haemophilus parainfluenzae]